MSRIEGYDQTRLFTYYFRTAAVLAGCMVQDVTVEREVETVDVSGSLDIRE